MNIAQKEIILKGVTFEKEGERCHNLSLQGGKHLPSNFVLLHLFPSRMDAEMAGELLKEAEIPFIIQSEDIGLFGPGATPAPAGARLMVQKNDLEDARVLLTGLI